MSEIDIGRIERIERDVCELRHCMFGGSDGNPGVRSKVDRIEVKMETGVKILWGLLALAVPSAISMVTTAATLIAYFK